MPVNIDKLIATAAIVSRAQALAYVAPKGTDTRPGPGSGWKLVWAGQEAVVNITHGDDDPQHFPGFGGFGGLSFVPSRTDVEVELSDTVWVLGDIPRHGVVGLVYGEGRSSGFIFPGVARVDGDTLVASGSTAGRGTLLRFGPAPAPCSRTKLVERTRPPRGFYSTPPAGSPGVADDMKKASETLAGLNASITKANIEMSIAAKAMADSLNRGPYGIGYTN